MDIQWNPSNLDPAGTEEGPPFLLVRFMGMGKKLFLGKDLI